MGGLIIPKTYVRDVNAPLIFLGGPIQNAPNWQDKAVVIILSQDPELFVLSPRRGVRQSIESYILKGDETFFPRQRAWERHYLKLASRKGEGTVMFWLPGEEVRSSEYPYGATTRFELGQLTSEYRIDKSVSFCIGSDGTFPVLDVIKYDLSLDAPDKKIFGSLEETCTEAVRLARRI
ncbi:MAG: hypothetical protein ABSD68_03385 [Candidatus Micrarchaeales archaeon]